MDEHFIYFFINPNKEKNKVVSSSINTNFKVKDLNNEKIELYILNSNYISKDFKKYEEYINMNQKVNFIFTFVKKENIENTLHLISYLIKYLKKNNKLHLKDLINYINTNYEIDLKYKQYFINILYNLDDLDLYILFFKNINIDKIISLFDEKKNNK